jgi:hypothetical protein
MKGHRWTEGDLKKLKRDGKIRGYKAKAPTEKTPAGRIVSKLFKYNAAAALGWRVYRYTASTYKNLENDLKCMSS